MHTVLVTGATGRIAAAVCPGLAEAGVTVRGTDIADLPAGLPGTTADLTDPAAGPVLAELLDGVDAVLHLGAIPHEDGWPRILAANIDATQRVLDAARAAGVGRVVLASSNHATGFTRRPPDGTALPAAAPMRPDTFYGVSKATMEALGALYAERHGMDVVALRIGSFLPRPTAPRHLATWLSPGDAVRLAHAALTTPEPGFATVWGISANTRRWWSLTEGATLGYHPVDDSEGFAGEILAGQPEPDWYGDEVLALVGGDFATRG
ncbi:MAG: NAD-dependent epimerase/dehydratase family protein [Pseudonocardiaceae bacterium]|nr:NAD-dependent epimerase/dehydratase family protein [Pseudonocardiaceae bacterium]